MPADCLLRRLRLPPLCAVAVLLVACGGGGGGGGGTGTTGVASSAPQADTSSIVPATPDNNDAMRTCPTLPAAGTGTEPTSAPLRGRVTFDRIPFFPPPTVPFATFAPGLDYADPVVEPARGVVVEAVAATGGSCTGNVVATTLTDGDGWYGLNVNTDQTVCVRVRAQLYRTGSSSGPGWNIAVVDNTASNSLYVLADDRFATARSEPRRDLHAASGWVGGAYTGTRAAAPFAIVDTACKAVDAVLDVQPTAQFGAMTFDWSIRNTEDGSGALSDGKIGGAFYSSAVRAVYLRGDAATNTDEFDEMVIAHEFGHFLIDQFSRSDSTGGDHSLLDYLDPRLAFEEGWATAFAGLALHSRVYRDSDEVATATSPSREYYFFLDDMTYLPRGWYTEGSVQDLVYGFGIDTADGGVGLGLGPIWQVMTADGYRHSDALHTLFTFGSALEAAVPAQASAIAARLNDQQTSGDAIEPWASTEANAPDTARDLPVYQPLAAGGSQSVCSRNIYAQSATTSSPNKLSMIRYLRLTVPAAGSYRISAAPARSTGLAGLSVYRQGQYIACGSGQSNIESLVQGNSVALSCPLVAGDYVLAVYQTDFSTDAGAQQGNYDQCFTVRAEVQ